MARTTVRRGPVNRAALERACYFSSKLFVVLEAEAKEINEIAKGVFLMRQDPTNEHRATFPRYAESFRTRKVARARKILWHAYNFDPIAGLVEFGAHIGKNPERPVAALRYLPFRTAVEIKALFN